MRGEVATITRREKKSTRNRNGLIQYAYNNTSQSGEDGIIERIFQVLPNNIDLKRERNDDEFNAINSSRICVDVGAWDGVHLSNTFSLLVKDAEISNIAKDRQAKWKGLLIEADKKRFEELRKLHEPLGNSCLCAEVSCIPESPRSLSSIIRSQSQPIPIDFDFLSIDVDGPDYWIMDDILKIGKYTPKLICVEFNPSMPDDLIYIQERSDTIRHGSSLSALYQLAMEHSYTLVETTLYNAFFLRTNLYEQYFQNEIPEPTIENLHENTMGTALYQLYDGTLKISGCKKMLWHRLPIDEKKIQILPPSQRSFPFAPSSTSRTSSEIRDLAIDMSPYYLNTNQRHKEYTKEECATRLFQQFQSNGFALIRGTGFSSILAQKGLHATKSLLQDANEDVRRSALAKDRARRGYSPMNTENFASLIGVKGHNDLVRKFRVGPWVSQKALVIENTSNSDNKERDSLNTNNDDDNYSGREYKSSSSPLLSPNVWPKNGFHWDKEQCQFFQESIENYYDLSCLVANKIVEAICDGIIMEAKKTSNSAVLSSLRILQSDENSIRNSTERTSILTLLSYCKGSRHKGKFNRPLVAPHTDVGLITMLFFDGGNCATLQRQCNQTDESTSDWIDVHLPSDITNDDPVFVVNIGDCLSDLCGNILPSTIHRVMPLAGKESRNCLALFVGLDPETELTLPSGDVMNYEEWRKRRIARATSILKS